MTKRLLTTIIMSFILLGISLLSYALLHNFIILCFFMCIIMFFIVSSAYSILIKKTDYTRELEKYVRYPFLREDVNTIIRAYKSIENRKEYVSSLSNDSVVDIYNQVRAQVLNNISAANSFCMSYDYVVKGDTSYLHELATECNDLVTKLNKLFEELIDVENSVFDIDTSKIDDLIEALQAIKKK